MADRMKIAHFFTGEWGGSIFNTYAEVSAYETEHGSDLGKIMEVWQTADGEVFESEAEAEQHVRDEQAHSTDWDGLNMRCVEMIGWR